MPQRQECVAHFTLDPQWALGRGGDCTLGEHNQAGITDTVHRAPCWFYLRVFQAPEFLKKSPPKSSPEDLIVKPREEALGPCPPSFMATASTAQTSPPHYMQRYCNSNSSLPGLLWEIGSLTHGLYGYPKAPGKFQGAVSRGILSVITGTWPTAHLGPPLPGMGTSSSWPRGGARNKTSKASFCCGSCASLPPSLSWA